MQAQRLPDSLPIDKYLYQPVSLDEAIPSEPRIILLDKYLVQQIPSEFAYTPIVSGRAMEVGIIARK